MAYIPILDSELDAESESRDGTPSLLKKLRDNPIAIATALATDPPQFQDAAFQDNTLAASRFVINTMNGDRFKNDSIPQAKINSQTCNQSKVKSALFTLLTNQNDTVINGAGLYMLGYQHFWEGSLAPSGTDRYEFSFGGGRGGATGGWRNNQAPGLTFMDINIVTGLGIALAQIDVTYFDASPPYNLGNGDIPLFVFMRVDSNGDAKSIWISKNPPWAYNGPTEIKPHFKRDGKLCRYRRRTPCTKEQALSDPAKMEAFLDAIADPANIEVYEVTQAVKNADMPLIPSGFPDERDGETIIMLDPVSTFSEQLADMYNDNDHFGALFGGNYVRFGNEPIRGAIVPPGVMPVRAWFQ